MKNQKFVGYIRVSTKRQGESGLGLEAQRDAVAKHVAGAGGVLIAEYREVESGKNCDRKQLTEALRHCRMAGATLVIAKLDRLARNVHFTSGMMESKVEFVACDNPNATRLIIHVLAAVAEDEARSISQRTKAGLGARRASGLPMGSNCLSKQHGVPIGQLVPLTTTLRNLTAARQSKSKLAISSYADYIPILRAFKDAGQTLRGMAAELNSRGYTTRSGKPWNHVQVARVLARESSP